MVQNFGYTRSYGSVPLEAAEKRKLAAQERQRAVAELARKTAAAALKGVEGDEAQQAVARAYDVVMYRACTGTDEELPHDVAQTLLNRGVQHAIVERVMQSAMNLRDGGELIDMHTLQQNLSTLDEAVLARLRQ